MWTMSYASLQAEVESIISRDPEAFAEIGDVAILYIAMTIRDPDEIRSCIELGISPEEAWSLLYEP